MKTSFEKDFDMIMSWLLKNHPKVLAKYAEYLNNLEEEE